MLKNYIAYLFIALVFIASGLFFYLNYYSPFKKSEKSNRVEFIDEIGIEEIRFKGDKFDRIAESLGIWTAGVYDWADVGEEGSKSDKDSARTQKVLQPQKIIVVLTSKEQGFAKAWGKFEKEGDNVLLYSLGQELKDSTVILKLHFSEKYFPKILEDPGSAEKLSYQAVFGLSKMSVGSDDNLDYGAGSVESQEKVRSYIKGILDKEGLVFGIGEEGLLRSMNFFLERLRPVKSVYAQGCVGLVFCGVTTTNIICSTLGWTETCGPGDCGENVCDKDLVYGYQGICNCTFVCDFGDDVNLFCPFRDTEALCTGPAGSCPAPFDCTDPLYESSCSWSGPPLPFCGDGACNGAEDCNSCPGDCGVCPPVCGDGDCNGAEDCSSCPVDCGVCPSCTIKVNPMTTAAGQTGPVSFAFDPLPVPASADVDQITVSTSNASVATVCETGADPCGLASYTDSTLGLSADYKGQSIGTATITVTGVMVDEGGVACTPGSNTVTVSNPSAWWQVHEGDTISGGNISSVIAALAVDPYFATYDESPGIPMFSGLIDPGSGGVSVDPPYGWQAEGASYSSSETHDYAHFFERIPEIPVTGAPADPGSSISVADLATTGALGPAGYYWFSSSGNLTITNSGAETLGDSKVVLFVDGDHLTIEGNILLNDGFGFFIAIVSGDILVDPGVGRLPAGDASGVPQIEGLYVADGQIRTGTTGAENDSQLHVRGSVVGLTGIVLERSLSDNSKYPAEIFEYGLDQAFLFPASLGTKRLLWREVAP